VYSYSTNPLSIALTPLLSQRMQPIDSAVLIDTLRSYAIDHIAYFPTCASAPRYRSMVDFTDVVYSGSHIQILTISEL
jgi:hypothetical protein